MDEDRKIGYDKVEFVNITGEVKDSFLDYAMSVIVQRALPDAQDGLKPVQRRILYGMNGLGNYANAPYKKSARIVGEVMGKYHPHGDSSIYDAMVRMAQPFSYRYPLVDGHGNFGSIDGDGAAAQRYTEARMSKISMEMLRDIQKDTVDFMDNYDGEEQEPVILPAHVPNLLINGATGIAVGMATNIPPHNIGEVIDAIDAMIDNPEITVVELMNNYLPGPDFPTGGYILGRSGIRKAYETGKGIIYNRGKAEINELETGKHEIVITEIPYGINKKTLFETIRKLARDKVVEGITNMVDSSNMNGIHISIEVRKDVQPEVVLNHLYQKTSLQVTYGANMLALINNAPRVMNIRELLQAYIDHQKNVVVRKTRFDLNKAEDRAHILEGLLIAIDNIDEIINIIRSSQTDDEASNRMIEKFHLDEIQTKSILDMQMRRLTGLQRLKIEEEYNQLELTIVDLKDILLRPERVQQIIKDELAEMKDKYNDPRRTQIIEAPSDLDDADLIPVENVMITLTTNGYIKRTTVDTYKTQNRGGKGVKGMTLNSDDIVDKAITMSSHDDLLLFSNKGRVYRIKGYTVPVASRIAKGLPVVNLLHMQPDEKICAMIDVIPDETLDSKFMFFVTKKGLVKRVAMPEFLSIRTSGKIAINLREDDALFGAMLTSGDDEIIIAGSNGKAIRFNETDVRPMGRTAAGVKGFDTQNGEVVGVATDKMGPYILSVTEKGYGKKTPLEDYRKTRRGGKGVSTINITEKNGALISMMAVNGDEDVLIVTNSGITIRISLEPVSIYGRNTQGVRLIKVDEADKVQTIALIAKEEDTEEENVEDEESKGE